MSLIGESLESQLTGAARGDGIRRFVVAALIVADGKGLLLRRRPDDFKGGIYELPGGVVESGEMLAPALTREVAEETGLTVSEVSAYLGSFDYRSGSGEATRQFNFQVRVPEPCDVRLSEHDLYLWAGREELAGLPVSDETRRVLLAGCG